MAEVAPAGAKEVDQRPNTHDPFWDGQNDILKTCLHFSVLGS